MVVYGNRTAASGDSCGYALVLDDAGHAFNGCDPVLHRDREALGGNLRACKLRPNRILNLAVGQIRRGFTRRRRWHRPRKGGQYQRTKYRFHLEASAYNSAVIAAIAPRE